MRPDLEREAWRAGYPERPSTWRSLAVLAAMIAVIAGAVYVSTSLSESTHHVRSV